MTSLRMPFGILLGGLLLVLVAAPPARAAGETAPATAAQSASVTAEQPAPAAAGQPPLYTNAAPPVGGPALTSASPSLYPSGAPTRVRVTILSAPGALERATRMAVLLDRYRRRELEQRIGLQLELINVSAVAEGVRVHNVIYYRPSFLRAALMLAEALPGAQSVQPMREESLKKAGVDVEVWVGEDSP